MTIGLIFILRGTFKMTLRPKLKSESQTDLKVVILQEGDYIDCERLNQDYAMLLDSLECESGTGKTLSLNHDYYSYLKHNSNLLSRDKLHPLVLRVNPPMSASSEKRATVFLQMF